MVTTTRPIGQATIRVAAVLPVRIASWIAAAAGATAAATRLRALTQGIPVAAYVVTGLVWLPLVPNGILYPIFDSANLNHSWGGPTLAGAWAVHLAFGLALLLAVALPFALWQRRSARLTESGEWLRRQRHRPPST
jgi:thiosulfate reductase cytochrome b subunit